MEEKPVRKTTVKKAVRRTTTKVAPRKTVVKKTAATTVRKAPARSVQEPVRRKKRSRATIVVPLLCLIVVGASVAVGYTDKGQLTLTNANSQQAAQQTGQTQDGQNTGMTVPVQDGQNAAVNGGLVGAGKTPQEPLPPPVEQASTTQSAASSTEAVDADVQAQEEIIEEAQAEEPEGEGGQVAQ